MALNVRDWKSRSLYLLLCSDVNFLCVLGQAIYFNCLVLLVLFIWAALTGT